MDPLSFMARLAAQIPHPKLPLIRYHGELFATSRHVNWAVLMKRTWGLDVMRCPACSHRLRVVATITEQAVVTKILDPLKVRKAPLPCATARDPTWVQESFAYEHAVA